MRRLFAALALAALLTGCAAGGSCVAASAPGEYSLSLDGFTGTHRAELSLRRGDEVAFSVDRQSGRIDLSLTLDGALYTGNDAQSGSFTVVIPADGVCVFTLTASRADGSVRLVWDTE